MDKTAMMSKTQKTPSLAKKAALITLSAVFLAGCLETTNPPQNPLYQRLTQSQQSVNPDAALGLINSYRQTKGLPLLALDTRLMQAANKQAIVMAEKGQVSSKLRKDLLLTQRLKQAKFPQTQTDQNKAAENISAGYWTLAEAFSGWRQSKRHNAVMLKKDATHMGIATAYNPNAKYGVYWSLILASPNTKPNEATTTTPRPKPR
ncbi:MAG: CAP domain-containing protein [Cohaesibacter sp.]|nr:CAP domain-containing protein [Cohaesibacter sp.]MCV6601948.1 CAP domain-containing protein [Cohaesibacter sp.]